MKATIDIVYLWCDMSDPQWNARRRAVAAQWKDEVSLSDEETASRYQSHDELRYSLRSMEMYAPWINNVFIVVSDDNALPAWLNTDNPRLHIIRHSEIIPQQYLPTYNSVTIEHFISRIPQLSEYFLYSNDDMFFFDHVTSAFFFDEKQKSPSVAPLSEDEATNGYIPIRRVSPERLNVLPKGYYYDTIRNALKLVTGGHPDLPRDILHALSFVPFHNIDSYRKSHHRATFERYESAIEASLTCPFRRPADIQRAIYLMEEVAAYGAPTVCDVSCTPLSKQGEAEQSPFSMDLDGTKAWRRGLDNALRLHPKLLCINAWQDNTPDDFQWLHLAMEMLFPVPSPFEK